jgi:hypothetical protein
MMEPRGTTRLLKPLTSPTRSPPHTAPQNEPMPPITTTMKAGMTASAPMVGLRLHMGAATTPATPASAVPSPNTQLRMRVRSMPSARTISPSCAPALMMAPYGVFSRNHQTSARSPSASPATRMRYFE